MKKILASVALVGIFVAGASDVVFAGGNIPTSTVTGAKTYGAWTNPTTYEYSASVYTDDTLADSKCAGSRYAYNSYPSGQAKNGYRAVNGSGAGTTRVESVYFSTAITVSWTARRSAVNGCDM